MSDREVPHDRTGADGATARRGARTAAGHRAEHALASIALGEHGDGGEDGGEPDLNPAVPRARPPLDWRSRVIIAMGVALVRLLATTWRFRQVGYEPVRALRARGAPGIYAFWHSQMLAFLALHRGEGIAVLISAHRDGERIAQAAQRFGFHAIRGSTFRGAASALRRLVRALSDWKDVAVTPDGPRGPAEQFAPGAIIAAQQAGVPIVLMAAAANRAWRLRSWDRFVIPWPFARITVFYSEPLAVPAESAREAAATAAEFQARLDLLNSGARES